MSDRTSAAFDDWSPEGADDGALESTLRAAEEEARGEAVAARTARTERARAANEAYLEQKRANEQARAAEESLLQGGVYVETTTVTDEEGNEHRLATKVVNDRDNRSAAARLRRIGWGLHEMLWQVALMVAATLFGFWLLNGGWETVRGLLSGIGISI